MLKFITGNEMKLKEARAIMPDVQHTNIDLPEVQEIDPHKIIAAKVVEAQKVCEPPFFVEDTSFYLDCFAEQNGATRMPGPLIKWFLATIKNTGLAHMAEKYNKQGAFAQTIIGFVDESGKTHFFENTNHGRVVQPQGTHGFGWDHIFVPNGSTKTYACMTQPEKLGYSARGAALRALRDFLQK